MAKFSDYNQKDDLDEEINEASTEAANREPDNSGFELPERFQGKSAEEIAQSYVELEKMNSRQAQDLGQMKRTLDDFTTLQSDTQTQASPTEAPAPLTVDDLYDNPDESIARKVESVAGDRIAKLEAQLQQEAVNQRLIGLEQKFPGWQDTVKTPEFQNWVNESPLRMRLVQAADKWDMDAADDILSLHAQYNEAAGTVSAAERERQLADGTLETGSASGQVASEETFSRSDLQKIRIKARQGDPEAATYLRVNGDAIAYAYEEGNITD